MKIEITVEGRVGRLDIPSFSITQNEDLTILFKGLSSDKAYRHIVTFLNGDKTHTVTLFEDMSATLNYEFLKDGETVSILIETHSSKTDKLIVSSDPSKDGYFIEPLKLEKVSLNMTAIGWMSRLEVEMADLRKRMSIAEKDLEEFKDIGVPLLVERNNENNENNENTEEKL